MKTKQRTSPEQNKHKREMEQCMPSKQRHGNDIGLNTTMETSRHNRNRAMIKQWNALEGNKANALAQRMKRNTMKMMQMKERM